MDEKKQINEILEKTGLNWTVRTEGLRTDSGIVIPEMIAIVRNDNQIPLGVHSDGYVLYQNEDLLELLFKINKQTGLSFHSGGSFKDGRRLWFQLKSDNLHLKNDVIEGFITGINSYDGSTSLSFGTSNNTISCQNSFWRVYRSIQTKMKHSASMLRKIDEILKNIDRLIEEEKHTFKTIERLAEIKMSEEVKEMVIRKLFDLSKEERLDSEEISTVKKNKMDRFYLDLKKELSTKEDSLWGLFNGVTRYTTHSMKKGDNTEGKIFGTTGKLEIQIFDSLAALTV